MSQHTEASTHKPSAVLQSVFYVMVFVADIRRGGQHIYFFERQKKIKELQANTQNKNTRQKKLPEAK